MLRFHIEAFNKSFGLTKMTADEDGPPKRQVGRKKTKFSLKRTKKDCSSEVKSTIFPSDAKSTTVPSEVKSTTVPSEAKSTEASTVAAINEITDSPARSQTPVALREEVRQSWDECVGYLLIHAKLLEAYFLRQELEEARVDSVNH